MTIPVYAGFDPGSRASALGVADKTGEVVYATHLAANGRERMIEEVQNSVLNMYAAMGELDAIVMAFAVEDQVYRGPRRKGKKRTPPQQLIPLSQVAGAAFNALQNQGIGPCSDYAQFVTPFIWKNDRAKDVDHRRLCDALGWEWGEQYLQAGTRIVPTNSPFTFRDTQWPDVLDAIGIARWLARMEQTR